MKLSYCAPYFCLLCCSLPVFAQQPLQPALAPDATHRLVLDVAVTDRASKAVKGLEEKDFEVLDNGSSQKILSFRASGSAVVPANVQPAEPPVKIILMVDEVNTSFRRVAYERDQIKRFLLQHDGKLAEPMSLAFFSDAGTEIQDNPSRDGNALLASFDQHETALRTVRRSQGFYGAVERFQLSLTTLQSLIAKEGPQPGRKIVVWISPGWPLLSGINVQLDNKEVQSLFASIVSLSTSLRQARMTIYSVDPLGVEDAVGTNATYYEEFLKPITVAKKAQAGDLGLQVLATQSGGLVLRASNDITDQINRCLEDVEAYYTLTIDAAPADQPNLYHALTVKVAPPGLAARTRAGYYAQP